MNIIRQSLVGLCLAVFALIPVRAQTPVTDPSPAVTIVTTPSYVSVYMFRGTEIGAQSIQPSVSYTYKALFLEVWGNTPFLKNGRLPGQPGAEIDPQGSYTVSINDSLSIQPGFTWYNYSRPVDGDGLYRSTFEPNLGVSYTVEGVTISPKAYYDVVLHGPTYELNVTHTVPIKALDTEIDFLGTIGSYEQTDVVNGSVPTVKSWGNYWLAGFTVPLQYGKHSQVSIGWAYTKGTDAYTKQAGIPKEVNVAAVGRGVTTISYAWAF